MFRDLGFSSRLCLVALLGFASCAKPPESSRPAPGDVVSVQLVLPEEWRVGEPVVLGVRLRLTGPNDIRPGWLKNEEVPADATPRATITFRHDEAIVKVIAGVPLTVGC